MIKIISGEFKGRLLKAPKNARPILAQIKKSVFDTLTPYLQECIFLDLYAGSGAVGIEALSRGAKFCVFVEKQKSSLKVLSENIIMLNCQSRCYIIKADVLKDLFWVEKAKEILKSKFDKTSFDIIFIGAPYVERRYFDDRKFFELKKMCEPTLQIVANSNLLTKDGVLVLQHSKKETFNTYNFELFRVKKYGETLISFLRSKKIIS